MASSKELDRQTYSKIHHIPINLITTQEKYRYRAWLVLEAKDSLYMWLSKKDKLEERENELPGDDK